MLNLNDLCIEFLPMMGSQKAVNAQNDSAMRTVTTRLQPADAGNLNQGVFQWKSSFLQKSKILDRAGKL